MSVSHLCESVVIGSYSLLLSSGALPAAYCVSQSVTTLRDGRTFRLLPGLCLLSFSARAFFVILHATLLKLKTCYWCLDSTHHIFGGSSEEPSDCDSYCTAVCS